MASQAVNYRSFLKAIADKFDMTRHDENSFLYLKKIINPNIEEQQAISIKTASQICIKLANMLGISDISPVLNYSNILSVNTALNIIDRYFGNYNIYSEYVRSYLILPNLSGDIFERVVIVASPTEQSSIIQGTVIGGGGGGSGGYAADGDKNASYTILVNGGQNGEDSYVLKDGIEVARSQGGVGGASLTIKVGGDPNVSQQGNDGGSAISQDYEIPVADGTKLTMYTGRGGSGSGGVAVVAGGNTGSITISNSGMNYMDGNGTINEWSGNDLTFGGGGGGGGSRDVAGNSTASGPNQSIIPAETGYAYTNYGGRGGYNNRSDDWGIIQPQNEDGYGKGGLGGRAKNILDLSHIANGGNGGNWGRLEYSVKLNQPPCILLRISN